MRIIFAFLLLFLLADTFHVERSAETRNSDSDVHASQIEEFDVDLVFYCAGADLEIEETETSDKESNLLKSRNFFLCIAVTQLIVKRKKECHSTSRNIHNFYTNLPPPLMYCI